MKNPTRMLPVRLTEHEIVEKAQRAAELVTDVASLEDAKKAAAADFKERIDAKQFELKELSRQIKNRTEDREVECEERPDYVRRVVEIFRCDTYEFVESRAMAPHELQESLLDRAAEKVADRIARDVQDKTRTYHGFTGQPMQPVNDAAKEHEATKASGVVTVREVQVHRVEVDGRIWNVKVTSDEDAGFVGECSDMQGVIVQGESVDEVLTAAKDTIKLLIEDDKPALLRAPEPEAF